MSVRETSVAQGGNANYTLTPAHSLSLPLSVMWRACNETQPVMLHEGQEVKDLIRWEKMSRGWGQRRTGVSCKCVCVPTQRNSSAQNKTSLIIYLLSCHLRCRAIEKIRRALEFFLQSSVLRVFCSNKPRVCWISAEINLRSDKVPQQQCGRLSVRKDI